MKMQTKRIGDVLEVSGKTRAGNESFPILSITMNNGLIDQSDKFKKRIASKDTSNYKVVYKNELVVGFPIDEGVIDFQTKYKKAIVSPAYDIWKIKDGISCNIDFIGRYLRSTDIRRIYKAKMRGAVARRRKIPKKNFVSIEIPFPSLEDQNRIATILIQMEEIILKRKESIELLDALLESVFYEMFGERVQNQKKWKKKKLKCFGQIITGNTPPRKDQENYSSNYIEWIKTDNICEDKTYITEAVEYLSEVGLTKGRTVKSGALLVTCIAGSIESIGRAAITDRYVAFNQQINAIQPNEDVNILFFYWLLKTSRPYIQTFAKKGMKKIISKSIFESIDMIFPPIPIQNKFGIIVEKVEVMKEKYRSSLVEIENLYNSLSYNAYKGELNLTKIKIDDIKATMVDEINEIGSVNVQERNKTEFVRKDLLNIIRKYSGKTFSFEEIWDEILALPSKKIPSRHDVQNQIIELLESDEASIQQVFDELTTQHIKKDNYKQIAFRR
jgi:type I restriction enzyme S subunit